LLSDLRYGIRTLLKSPRFSIIAILALAIGIGANTAMFSVVYNVLLRPLPYPRSDRLVFVQETSLRRGGIDPTAPATYFDWRDQQHSFASIAAAEAWGASLTGSGRPEEVSGLHVSPELLTVLQAAPMLGRGFLPDDATKEAGRVVLLSHALWQRRFGGDPSVIDRSITLNGAGYRVIGVMPPGFHFPPFWQEKAELWAPLVFPPERLASRSSRSLRVFARLKDGVGMERASAEMSTIARRLELAWPQSSADRGVIVMPLTEAVVGKTRTALLVLLGAVTFLLLIACANVANLLLARASGRQKEIALRLALGAGRWRLVRQLLAESLLLAAAAGALGVLLSWWAIHALAAGIPEASRFTLPRYQEVGIGGVVLLFTLGISAATSILFGLAPALQFSRPNLHATLKDGGRGNSRQSRTALRKLLVAGEVAVSLMLLAGAGLMVRSLSRLGAVDPGFDPRNVLTMRVVLTGSPYAAPERRNAFCRQVLDRVASVPGVESASGINHLPLAGDLWTLAFTVEGRPAPPPSDVPGAAFRVVFPGYFGTMRIPILRGRDFTHRDDAAAPRVVAINESMARRYWPGEDATGKRIHLGGADSGEPWLTVAAVVKDAEQRDWGAAADNEFYFPYGQNPDDFQRYLTLVVRTAGDPLALAGAVQQQVWALDRDLPIPDVLSMRQVVDRAVWQPRFSTSILAGFAVLALLLAAVGIYGVISYSVSQRRNEIGIRMALGARPADVLRAVLGEAAALAGAGAAAGLCAALLLTRYLKSLLYEVSATDPMVLLTAAGILTAIALAAAWLPAHRATQIDPIAALRQD
jgi:putative ABC transport system permease protein